MLNNAFDSLRKKLTIIYTAVFSVIILVILLSAYGLIWFEIIGNEKAELISQAYHETEEWINSGEKPCSQTSIDKGSMLAYFVAADDKTVILNQLGNGAQGKAILNHQGDWPKQLEGTRILRMHSTEQGQEHVRYRYLSAVVPVVDGGKTIGRLYMFKNIGFYYDAAYESLFMLMCLAVILLLLAGYFSYWVAGINIRPLKQMYEKQKQFTADASHEMRTPLSVMRLAVTALKEDSESKYSSLAADFLKMLGNEVDNMSRLTHRLMELARSEQDSALSMENVALSSLCEDVGKQLQLLARDKNIALETLVEPEIFLKGNTYALRRLLIILLDNAIKYSTPSSRINLRLYKSYSHITLEVADEGDGIKDDDKRHVFDRFYRVDKARSRGQGGFGLGLSLAQGIAMQHGAVIKVKDNKPVGTIMQVVFNEKMK